MKFADTCLVDMLDELLSHGAKISQMYAKIAGGAKMFSFNSDNDMLNIGEQNVEAVRRFLQEHQIPIRAESVGDKYGRTIVFSPDDGALRITAIGKGDMII